VPCVKKLICKKATPGVKEKKRKFKCKKLPVKKTWEKIHSVKKNSSVKNIFVKKYTLG
jgi:hypothetical protein